MGQEARCTVHWKGQTSEGVAHLETSELVFRGRFRLAIPFANLRSVDASQGRLSVESDAGRAVFELGAKADKWAASIRKPRSLIDKLGVKAGQIVDVVDLGDQARFVDELSAAGADVATGTARQASDMIFLGVSHRRDLDRLAALKRRMKPNGSIWVVRRKGSHDVKEGDVLAAGKRHGLVDIKVVAFSETHSSLKLVIPVTRRSRAR